MSFILDALKKSEVERQRQSVPGLIDSRASPRRSRLPIWAIALCVLLAINLSVLTYVLMRKSAPAAQASAPAAAAPAAAAAAPPTAAAPAAAVGAVPPDSRHFSPLDTSPQYAPEIPVAPRADSTPAQSPPRHTELTREPDAGRAPPAHRADPLLTESASTDNEEVLPTISEISLTGAQALPELHLDVHVYATQPAERFVYINMRKYHEGSKLEEGPTVERIRRDGVVLSYQGLRFLLPRQP